MMRIAIVNSGRRKSGGSETYLGSIIPALAASGHHLAFWHEWEGPLGRERIALPESVSFGLRVEVQAALLVLREWQPD